MHNNIIEMNRRYRDVFPQGRCDDGLYRGKLVNDDDNDIDDDDDDNNNNNNWTSTTTLL